MMPQVNTTTITIVIQGNVGTVPLVELVKWDIDRPLFP